MGEPKLNYGNWVRKRILFVLGVATLAVGALDLMFSESGGGFQAKLYGYIVQKIGQDLSSRYLDIGSGNGVLTVSNKRLVLEEALRVIKPRGIFTFVDYFLEPRYYGRPAEFRDYLAKLGLADFQFTPLHEVLAVPTLLKHPRILGRVAVLSGRK